MRIIHFTTDRRHGHARAPRALSLLLRRKRLPAAPAVAEQVHGSKVVWVPLLTVETKYPGADGLLTQAVDQPLAIFTADCVPVFLSVPSRQVVGLLHAGWRGVRGEILKKAVSSIQKYVRCPAGEISIWTGPAIGPCCFEVKWDVARYFPATRRRRKDRWILDLSAEIRRQARRLGVRFISKPGGRTCTMHHRQFYSFRRDATMNRQVSVILMKDRRPRRHYGVGVRRRLSGGMPLSGAHLGSPAKGRGG